jgi:cytochrome P450
MAHRILRTWTPVLRPFVQWFIPECRRVRQLRTTVKKVIRPIVKTRMAKGGASSRTSDMLGWIDDIAAKKNITVEMEDAQLFLAFAAIHTTTENLTYVLLELLDHPEAIEKLREEMIDVLKQNGWTKTTFSKMKLLDSVLKESQRLHPVSKSMYPFLYDLSESLSSNLPSSYDGA